MRTLGVPLRNDRVATLEKGSNTLQIDSGSKILIKVVGVFDLVALRDLLNDAYPVGVYVSGKDMRVRKQSNL
ncbi:hypothetical protein PMSD_11710 [Paenibacillus macquariensis subsp. defensor]|nr:hypothetical protein PMSD_11710 [Paenibacillus macquariensis subsp. defensor]